MSSGLSAAPVPEIDVSAKIAEIGVGQVGSYAFLWDSSQRQTPHGTNRAGSQLQYSNALSDVNETVWSGRSNVSVSGTWRCMGYTGKANASGTNYSYIQGARTTLWLRIS